MGLQGKSVLITGAGKGIGRASVADLMNRGMRVIALSRSAADLAEIEAALGCRTVAVDLADAEATRAAVRDALPFDYLVNCAGIAALHSLLRTPARDFFSSLAGTAP